MVWHFPDEKPSLPNKYTIWMSANIQLSTNGAFAHVLWLCALNAPSYHTVAFKQWADDEVNSLFSCLAQRTQHARFVKRISNCSKLWIHQMTGKLYTSPQPILYDLISRDGHWVTQSCFQRCSWSDPLISATVLSVFNRILPEDHNHSVLVLSLVLCDLRFLFWLF